METTKRILIVDDEPNIRVMFCNAFSNHDLKEADNVDTAMDLVSQGFKPDYVITDYHLIGKKNGIDLAMAIRAKLRSRIYVYSGEEKARSFASQIADTRFVDKTHEGYKQIVAAILGKTNRHERNTQA